MLQCPNHNPNFSLSFIRCFPPFPHHMFEGFFVSIIHLLLEDSTRKTTAVYVIVLHHLSIYSIQNYFSTKVQERDTDAHIPESQMDPSGVDGSPPPPGKPLDTLFNDRLDVMLADDAPPDPTAPPPLEQPQQLLPRDVRRDTAATRRLHHHNRKQQQEMARPPPPPSPFDGMSTAPYPSPFVGRGPPPPQGYIGPHSRGQGPLPPHPHFPPYGSPPFSMEGGVPVYPPPPQNIPPGMPYPPHGMRMPMAGPPDPAAGWNPFGPPPHLFHHQHHHHHHQMHYGGSWMPPYPHDLPPPPGDPQECGGEHHMEHTHVGRPPGGKEQHTLPSTFDDRLAPPLPPPSSPPAPTPQVKQEPVGEEGHPPAPGPPPASVPTPAVAPDVESSALLSSSSTPVPAPDTPTPVPGSVPLQAAAQNPALQQMMFMAAAQAQVQQMMMAQAMAAQGSGVPPGQNPVLQQMMFMAQAQAQVQQMMMAQAMAAQGSGVPPGQNPVLQQMMLMAQAQAQRSSSRLRLSPQLPPHPPSRRSSATYARALDANTDASGPLSLSGAHSISHRGRGGGCSASYPRCPSSPSVPIPPAPAPVPLAPPPAPNPIPPQQAKEAAKAIMPAGTDLPAPSLPPAFEKPTFSLAGLCGKMGLLVEDPEFDEPIPVIDRTKLVNTGSNGDPNTHALEHQAKVQMRLQVLSKRRMETVLWRIAERRGDAVAASGGERRETRAGTSYPPGIRLLDPPYDISALPQEAPRAEDAKMKTNHSPPDGASSSLPPTADAPGTEKDLGQTSLGRDIVVALVPYLASGAHPCYVFSTTSVNHPLMRLRHQCLLEKLIFNVFSLSGTSYTFRLRSLQAAKVCLAESTQPLSFTTLQHPVYNYLPAAPPSSSAASTFQRPPCIPFTILLARRDRLDAHPEEDDPFLWSSIRMTLRPARQSRRCHGPDNLDHQLLQVLQPHTTFLGDEEPADGGCGAVAVAPGRKRPREASLLSPSGGVEALTTGSVWHPYGAIVPPCNNTPWSNVNPPFRRVNAQAAAAAGMTTTMDFLSVAAHHYRLSLFWGVVKHLPYFCGAPEHHHGAARGAPPAGDPSIRQAQPFPLRSLVWSFDFEALRPEDQSRFLLPQDEILDDATSTTTRSKAGHPLPGGCGSASREHREQVSRMSVSQGLHDTHMDAEERDRLIVRQLVLEAQQHDRTLSTLFARVDKDPHLQRLFQAHVEEVELLTFGDKGWYRVQRRLLRTDRGTGLLCTIWFEYVFLEKPIDLALLHHCVVEEGADVSFRPPHPLTCWTLSPGTSAATPAAGGGGGAGVSGCSACTPRASSILFDFLVRGHVEAFRICLLTPRRIDFRSMRDISGRSVAVFLALGQFYMHNHLPLAPPPPRPEEKVYQTPRMICTAQQESWYGNSNSCSPLCTPTYMDPYYLFHLSPHRRFSYFYALAKVLVQRLQQRQDDRFTWFISPEEPLVFLSLAASRQRLSMYWPIIRDVSYFVSAFAALRGVIPLRSSWFWDFNLLPKEDQKLFGISHPPFSRCSKASGELYILANRNEQVSKTRQQFEAIISRAVHRPADILFMPIPPNQIYLIQLVHSGDFDVARYCVKSSPLGIPWASKTSFSSSGQSLLVSLLVAYYSKCNIPALIPFSRAKPANQNGTRPSMLEIDLERNLQTVEPYPVYLCEQEAGMSPPGGFGPDTTDSSHKRPREEEEEAFAEDSDDSDPEDCRQRHSPMPAVAPGGMPVRHGFSSEAGAVGQRGHDRWGGLQPPQNFLNFLVAIGKLSLFWPLLRVIRPFHDSVKLAIHESLNTHDFAHIPEADRQRFIFSSYPPSKAAKQAGGGGASTEAFRTEEGGERLDVDGSWVAATGSKIEKKESHAISFSPHPTHAAKDGELSVLTLVVVLYEWCLCILFRIARDGKESGKTSISFMLLHNNKNPCYLNFFYSAAEEGETSRISSNSWFSSTRRREGESEGGGAQHKAFVWCRTAARKGSPAPYMSLLPLVASRTHVFTVGPLFLSLADSRFLLHIHIYIYIYIYIYVYGTKRIAVSLLVLLAYPILRWMGVTTPYVALMAAPGAFLWGGAEVMLPCFEKGNITEKRFRFELHIDGRKVIFDCFKKEKKKICYCYDLNPSYFFLRGYYCRSRRSKRKKGEEELKSSHTLSDPLSLTLLNVLQSIHQKAGTIRVSSVILFVFLLFVDRWIHNLVLCHLFILCLFYFILQLFARVIVVLFPSFCLFVVVVVVVVLLFVLLVDYFPLWLYSAFFFASFLRPEIDIDSGVETRGGECFIIVKASRTPHQRIQRGSELSYLFGYAQHEKQAPSVSVELPTAIGKSTTDESQNKSNHNLHNDMNNNNPNNSGTKSLHKDGEEEEVNDASLVPIIPGAVQYKYYHVPEGFKRLRTKRKVAILFAYIGERYCGLQWNHLPEYPTVEEALLKALYEADMISLTNFSNYKVQQLLNFERASRTDKGVHALCNLVSINVMLPYDPDYVREEQERRKQQQIQHPGALADPSISVKHTPDPSPQPNHKDEQNRYSCAEARRLLRQALPQDIHVYDIVPVTRSFNAYLCCGGRRYEYFLPTFALLPPEAYSTVYFPEKDFALSHPTLKDVGFRPGKKVPGVGRRGPQEQQEQQTLPQEKGAEKAGGRRSKGHFPKANRKRKQEEGERVQREVEARDAARRRRMTDVEEEKSPAVAPLSGILGDGVEQDETPDGGGATAAAVDLRDPEALEEFLTSHAATHFQDHLFDSMILFRDIDAERMQHIGKHRITPAHLGHIRSLFHLYEGTYCYHNFTPGGRSTDASCHRFMRSITVSDPIIWRPDDPLLEAAIEQWCPSRFYAPDEGVVEAYDDAMRAVHTAAAGAAGATPSASPSAGGSSSLTPEEEAVLRERLRQHIRTVYPDGMEVVRIELDGQSFMLNQIRKMIGAVVCMSAAGLAAEFLTQSLLRKGVHLPVPMVPANGLLLSYMDFSGYGKRLDRIQQNGHNGAGKPGIDVEQLMDPEELAHQERRTVSVMLRNEMGNDLMGKWMRSLRHAVRLAWKVDIP
eukprot:gene6374-4599_t